MATFKDVAPPEVVEPVERAKKGRKAKVKLPEPKAVFDIHALRVTGVTHMLRAGMPPDLVQELVGHASLVMTLYYRDINFLELHEMMMKFYNDRESLAAHLKGLSPDDLAQHLFNIEDPMMVPQMFERGTGYQRPWGASWKWLVHGICPGGDCATGGEPFKGSFKPVRPTACSICRYRLTGPSFLPGLVANANLLLYQLRREAETLRELQYRKYQYEDEGRGTAAIEGEIQQIRLRFEDYAIEWGSEVHYINKAIEMGDLDDAEGKTGSLITADSGLEARLEERHELHLLQSIAVTAELGHWKPSAAARAVSEQQELMDRVLDANGYKPLLMGLKGEQRLRYGNKMAEIFLSGVPDDEIDGLVTGAKTIEAVMPPTVRTMFLSTVEELKRLASNPSPLIESSKHSAELELLK